ncbi:MAG: acyltransferase family protein, partial [Methylocystis sp.]|nr:acyltransferase family protein [Methylocystis sp.]
MTILLHHASVLTTGGDIAPLATKGDAVATMSQALAGGDAAFMRQTVVELLRPFLFALVGAFFVLSGFLVAGSAFRTKNVGRFLAFRILRIMPALSLVVLFSSFVLGPIVTTLTLGEYFQDFNFLRYFGNLCGLYWPQLPEVFTANPIPHATNWNLWTLTPEFSAYAVVTVLMLTGVIYREKEFMRLFLVISAALILIVALGAFGVATRRDTTNFSAWLIMYSFIAGVVMWACAKHIPLSRSLFLLCGVSYYVLMIAKWNDVLAVLTLAYCVVYVGMQPFAWFDRIVKG